MKYYVVGQYKCFFASNLGEARSQTRPALPRFLRGAGALRDKARVEPALIAQRP